MAPVDQMAQLEICFTKLGTFPINHSPKISLIDDYIFGVKIVMQQHGASLKIQHRSGGIQKPIGSFKSPGALRLQL